jgi:hypothetical protein
MIPEHLTGFLKLPDPVMIVLAGFSGLTKQKTHLLAQ